MIKIINILINNKISTKSFQIISVKIHIYFNKKYSRKKYYK